MDIGDSLGGKKGMTFMKRPGFNAEAWTAVSDKDPENLGSQKPEEFSSLSDEMKKNIEAKKRKDRINEAAESDGPISRLLQRRAHRVKNYAVERTVYVTTVDEKVEDLFFMIVLLFIVVIIVACVVGGVVRVLSDETSQHQTTSVMAELTFRDPWDSRLDYDIGYLVGRKVDYEMLGEATFGAIHSFYSVQATALRPSKVLPGGYRGTTVTYKITITDQMEIRELRKALFLEVRIGGLNATSDIVFIDTYFECRPGQIVLVEQRDCRFCPRDSYNMDPKATRCAVCPDGKITLREGALRRSECTRTPCYTPDTETATSEHDYVHVGHSAKYNCIEGYIFENTTFFLVECVGNGTLIGLQQCYAMNCTLPELENAEYDLQILSPNTTYVTFPTEVRITCDINKEIYPGVYQTTSFCEANGTMTSIPKCLKKQCILDEIQNNNIYIDAQPGDLVFVGDEVLVQCKYGYQYEDGPSQNRTITCEVNQIMSAPDECERVPCTLHSLSDLTYYNAAEGQTVYYGDVVEVLCPFGQALQNSTIAQAIQCQANGEMTVPQSCTLRNCTALELYGNNVYVNLEVGTVVEVGTVAAVRCAPGMEYTYGISTNTIFCQLTGFFSIPPNCYTKKCLLPTLPDHEYINMIHNGFIYIGDVISVRCKDTQKTMVGKATMEIVCNSDQTLNYPEPCTL